MIKTLKLIMIAVFLFGNCEAKEKPQEKDSFMARITYYTRDKHYGKVTASGKTAKEGVTVAAEDSFKFGEKFHIPGLNKKVGGNGVFVIHDRGPFVQRRVASRGKMPVIDVYVDSRSKMKELTKQNDNVFKVYKKPIQKKEEVKKPCDNLLKKMIDKLKKTFTLIDVTF